VSDGISLRVLELACSRLAHDLAGPVSAVRNGLELLEEAVPAGAAGDDQLAPVLELLGHSAEQAARRLQFYRYAYGAGGAETPRGFGELRQAAGQWLEGSRCALDWPEAAPPAATAARAGLAKSLLNLLLVAEEALPHGGTIAISGSGDATGGQVRVAVTGGRVTLRPEVIPALSARLAPEQLDPRSLHPYLSGRIAAAYGLQLDVDSDRGLALALRW